MPKKQKKTLNKKIINKKTKLKNTVNVKINIDNSRKTTGRRAATKAPAQQPFVNFPSSQLIRIQQLEPKQQFNNADLTNKLDSFQKQFNTYLETKVKPEVIEDISVEAIPRPTPPVPARPTPPAPARPAPTPPPPTVLQRLGSFFENRIDSFSTRDQEAIDRKEQQIKIKREEREQRQLKAQQEFEVKKIIRMQKEAREEQERLFNITYEEALQNQKQRETNERSMMESEDIPENLIDEEDIRDFIENASDEDIKLWLQNAQPDVKKATLKIIKEKVENIKQNPKWEKLNKMVIYKLQQTKPPKNEPQLLKKVKQESEQINQIQQIEENIKELLIERETTQEYGRKSRIDNEINLLKRNKREINKKLKESKI